LVIARDGQCAWSLQPPFQSTLEGYIGQSINQICSTNFTSPTENHCAHFVCHVLNIQYGLVCGSMTSRATRGQGATIRVNELYNNLQYTGPWASRPADVHGLLVFVLRAAHMTTNVMPAVPQKHVGIMFKSNVYHYSNSADIVVRESVDDFHTRFKNAYSGGDISLFYGRFP
jgi:hypothetical protein